MVYNQSRFFRFDRILLIAAVVVLAAALILLPKESFRLIKTKLTFAQNWSPQMDGAALALLSVEFQEENPRIVLELTRSKGDIEAFVTPNLGITPDFKDAIEVVSFINPLFYNIDILAASGFDRPPKTRDELVAAAKAVRAQHRGVEAVAFSENVFEDITPWFWSAGIVKEDAEDGEEVRWTSRAGVDTFTFLQQLGSEHIAEESAFKRGRDEKLKLFCAGKAAMYIGSTLDIIRIREKAPHLNFSVTAIPAPTSYVGKPVFNVTSWAAGIPRDNGRAGDARVFLDFLSKKRGGIAAAAGAVTAGFDVVSPPSDDGVVQKVHVFAEGASIVRDVNVFAESGGAVVLQEEIEKLWRGEQTPRDAAAAVEAALAQKPEGK